MDKADIKQLAKTLAKTLKERNKHAIRLIEQLIELMGIDFVQETMAEVQHIEIEKGGMMTNDGKRRRTRGGVFFYLIKQKLNREQREIIFPPPDWVKRRAKKNANAQAKQVKQVKQIPVAEKSGDEKVTDTSTSSKQSPDAASAEPTPVLQDVNTSTSSKLSADDASKLAKLETAAQVLRERLAEMEATGQKGISMTKTLLKNTEKQIDALQRTSDG